MRNHQALSRKICMVLAQLSAIICFQAGCGSETQSSRFSRKTVTLSEVPDEVMNAAKARLPDVEFADGWKNIDKDGKLHSYEIRGRTKNGKIRECRVSPTGEILEVE